MTCSESLKQFWQAGIKRVEGATSVRRALGDDDAFMPDLVVGVGKAASSMCLGALKVFTHQPETLVVTKYHHSLSSMEGLSRVQTVESGHPIPDEQSLVAGALLLARIKNMNADQRLLLLVSGGASSLVEVLQDNVSLDQWQTLNRDLLAGGDDIAEINKKRKTVSKIKAGGLLSFFSGAEVRVYAISDVQGDDIQVIGSGLGDCQRTHAKASSKIIASNQVARRGVEEAAKLAGYEVCHQAEDLYGDVSDRGREIGKILLKGKPGVYIFGGEPTIQLPPNPGQGGRNQSLALTIANQIRGTRNVTVLVGGTDGTDGPTDAAGAIVDGETIDDSRAARSALERADAGSYLNARNALWVTGPTHTNVMDLVIALVE